MKLSSLSLLVRLAVSIGSLAVIFYLVDFRALLHAISQVASLPFAVATLLVLPAFLITTPRWSIILTKLGYHIRSRQLYGVVLAGALLNQVLPTSVGGDVYRGWRVSRMGAPLGVVVNSVLLDRVFAFAAVGVLLLFGIGLSIAKGLPLPPVAVPVAVAAVAIVAGLAVAGPVLKRLSLLGLGKAPAMIATLSRALTSCFLDRDAAMALSALSLLNQIVIFGSIFLLGVGLGFALPYPSFITAVSASLLLSALPISFAGWGIREGAFGVIFAFYGVPAADGVALSVLFGAISIASALPGVFTLIVPTKDTASRSTIDGQDSTALARNHEDGGRSCTKRRPDEIKARETN
jgi:uncharacterized protein (TIRG00374 family)